MLSAVAASLSGLVVSGPVVVARGAAATRSAVVKMPLEKQAGEGDPFNLDANGVPEMRRSEDIAVRQPNSIGVFDMDLAAQFQYVENEDEPW